MVGITSYGAYIPWYRIDRKIIYSAMGWINPATRMPGEKAVANFDEDSITMAVAAGGFLTYTADNLAFTPSPPAIYGIVDFEGGGRFWFDFTDCDVDSLAVTMLMEMSFRRKYFDEHPGYSRLFLESSAGAGINRT